MNKKPFETRPVKIYTGERQSGKTTMLIKRSAETGETIVVATPSMCSFVKLRANYLGLEIPEPISLATFFLNIAQYGVPKDRKYLMDDLELCLQRLGIETATLDIDYIGRLKPENEKPAKRVKVSLKKKEKNENARCKINCEECAKKYHMPFKYCCLIECGEHAFCRGCANGIYYAKETHSEWR